MQTQPNSNQPQPLAHDDSPTTNIAPIPTDSDGVAENPDSYKPWKQKPVEGEPVTPQQFREKLAAMVEGLSMG